MEYLITFYAGEYAVSRGFQVVSSKREATKVFRSLRKNPWAFPKMEPVAPRSEKKQ